MSILQTIPNTQLTNLSKTVTSIELVELINKHRSENGVTTELRHSDFMAKVRKEADAGILGERNISFSSYLTSQNKEQPMYQLDKEASIYMVSGEIGQVRMAIIRRWTELETVVQAIADENHVTKEQLIQQKINAQYVKYKAMKEAANLRIEMLRTKHKQTMAILEAKTTKLLSQGAKVKGDMSVGKLTMPKSTITNLLKYHGSHIEPRDANYALVNLGYLESDRKTVTNDGSEFGTSNKSGNGKAQQAFWFDSEFVRLLDQIEEELYDLGIIDADGNYLE